MTFTIEKKHYDAIVAHAKAGYPNEACGIIAGLRGRVVRVYPTRNAEHSPVRYSIDPRQQLEVMREIESEGWELLGIFHSHTHSPAYPSQTDIKLAYYPEALYFIVSLMDAAPVVRTFYIVEGKISEEPLSVKVG